MSLAKPSLTPAAIELPAPLVEQLIDYGLKTPAGQVVLTTILNLNPELRAAIEQMKGAVKLTGQSATLGPGDPPKTPESTA